MEKTTDLRHLNEWKHLIFYHTPNKHKRSVIRKCLTFKNRINGVMFGALDSDMVDCGFESRLGQARQQNMSLLIPLNMNH